MNLSRTNRKWIGGALVFCAILGASLLPAGAEEQKSEEPKPSATVSMDILSQYIFRGVAFSMESAVLQPAITASYAGFSLSIWGNLDTRQKTTNPLLRAPVGLVDSDGRTKWNETDFTFSYTRELFKDFSVIGGTIYYSLPNAAYDATELFGGIIYNFPWFTGAFTAYREISHTPGWWLQLDLTKSIPLPIFCEGMSLDLGATLGYMVLYDDDTTLSPSGSTGSYSEFHSATINAALKIPVYKTLTVSPKIGVALPLTSASSRFIEGNSYDGDDTHVFGGINLTATF